MQLKKDTSGIWVFQWNSALLQSSKGFQQAWKSRVYGNPSDPNNQGEMSGRCMSCSWVSLGHQLLFQLKTQSPSQLAPLSCFASSSLSSFPSLFAAPLKVGRGTEQDKIKAIIAAASEQLCWKTYYRREAVVTTTDNELELYVNFNCPC